MLFGYGKLNSTACTNISRNELRVFSIALLLLFFLPQAYYSTEMLFFLVYLEEWARALVREHFSLFLVGT